jgi:hypothetical protein
MRSVKLGMIGALQFLLWYVLIYVETSPDLGILDNQC